MKYTFLALLSAFALCGQAQNPYLPLWEHLPDGEPRVFEDPDCPGKMRAYIIGSHDTHYSEYCGNDIRMWSAPVENLTQWRDEGPIFTYYVDGRWDTMYAPDLVETKDPQTGKKTYWLYPHSRGWKRVPMVCKGDRPDGPFTPVNLTPDGRACVNGSLIDFDPSVYIEEVTNKKDPDYAQGFRAYVFYGFQHSTACQLDPNTMFSKRPGTELIDPFIPASSHDGRLLDKEGSQYKALYQGQNPLDFNFFEASSIRKVGNKYVMVFSGHSGKEYGIGNSNSTLRYAYGDSPLGPWRAGGVLVDSRGVVPNADGTALTTTNYGHNTHGSLQEINGQWYVFYHRPPRGFGNARQAMVAPVKIQCDKKPVAKGGKVRITGYDAYAPNNEWTAKATNGMEYTGAEVTSEGFNIFGLPPYGYYSAGIACYLAGPGSFECMQDNHDVWNNSMSLTSLRNGTIIGFKYFGFGGLAQNTKGVPAFEGIGQGTEICLNLTPNGKEASKVKVMLDGPYDNNVWTGKEIAVIDIPANAPRWPQTFRAKVPAVEGLTGKHAIYLVTEGLLDLHGIGFADASHPFVVPEVPQVSIEVDGQRLQLPQKPLFTSNANGYTDVTNYQVYAPLQPGSKITANASSKDVQIQIGTIADNRATVRFTYKGKTKTYLIN
ncbi:MAG: hypothetical protein K6F47_01945 [Bacteroidaceae bacterium]|nr:hypothetical protein [Bacteroidaceae bacterium]